MRAPHHAPGGELVYTTEPEALCPACGRPRPRCRCAPANLPPPGDGIVRVGRQSQGHKGKGVTVVTGLTLGRDELARLATRLKRLCGAGGSVQGWTIESQGDHRDPLLATLAAEGWRVKRAGG